jgi:hypothetical protein
MIAMTDNRTAGEVLDRDFLDVRHRILDVAAHLDRIDSGQGGDALADDPRTAQIRDALEILHETQPDRAQRVQMTFSRPYDPNWRG